MRAVLLIAVVLLTGCVREGAQRGDMLLTCTLGGHITYQAKAQWWSYESGQWWSGYGGNRYGPSMAESCRADYL